MNYDYMYTHWVEGLIYLWLISIHTFIIFSNKHDRTVQSATCTNDCKKLIKFPVETFVDITYNCNQSTNFMKY